MNVVVGRWVAARAAADSGNFSDPKNARTIIVVATLLVLMAVGLAVWTAWWWRRSSSEHPSLGPLEVMGTRKWQTADPSLRRVRLDAARPVEEFDDDLDAYDGRTAVPAAPAPPAGPVVRPVPRDPLLRAQRAE